MATKAKINTNSLKLSDICSCFIKKYLEMLYLNKNNIRIENIVNYKLCKYTTQKYVNIALNPTVIKFTFKSEASCLNALR